MSLMERATRVFDKLKAEPFGETVIGHGGGALPSVALLPFTADCLANDEIIGLCARWRQENIHSFQKVFAVSHEGTRRWAKALLLDRPDRMLFFVRETGGRLVAHVGLSNVDDAAGSCELDNILRGERSARPRTIESACRGLIDWTNEALSPAQIRLRTFCDNARAVALYHRIGFRPDALHPLMRSRDPDLVEWIDAGAADPIDRFLIGMYHDGDASGAGAKSP